LDTMISFHVWIFSLSAVRVMQNAIVSLMTSQPSWYGTLQFVCPALYGWRSLRALPRETLVCGENGDGDLYMSRKNIHKASPAGIEGRCAGIQFRYRRTVVTGCRLHLHKSQGKTTSAEDKYVPKDHDQPQNRAATMTRQKVGGRSRQRIRLLRKTYVQCRSGSRLFPKSLTW